MKNKVSSKAQGIVIVAFEVAFFMLPFSLNRLFVLPFSLNRLNMEPLCPN